jgi:ribosomal subunit interface protein
MQIKYFFKKELTEEERKYLEDKLVKVKKYFKRLNKDELKVEVDIKEDKRGFVTADILVHTPYKHYRVFKKEKYFTEAVDTMMQALLKQVRREKEKIHDKRNKISKK